ncbi:MAG TPA: redoxin [Candidatus Marinimicrobia bacterium]|nr:redoxin [Candidatus Neomarinimicrobiota bacterium]MDP6229692.1 TlpA disulfide reductase family protein [Candidatus Neomarinimicrobiota bacterium]MDP6500176.1 TlpA disulfide reductase family protein [Candidatus Neomarinimicrobiota bacterium]MDP6726420.1 TlpA disulfide reductase family protein [Candidatus Neomarinimicrobiota bacterium]MDP7330172.1 TlpA disulfide reductase family protein [Candidatus Neomarinimicrobiota bacterium]|tara:strand:+ start:153 stop:680 length:528 start_codon:yes stop_codon:yes gene_type:complete
MNKLIIGIIIFLSFLNAVEPEDRGYIVKVGDDCPDFTLQMVDGTTISKKDLKGKIAVLQFTASWCSVCRKEMPHLEKDVWQQFKEKEFILIGIDKDEPLEVVKPFIEEMKVTYPIALDPGSAVFQLFAHKEAGVTRNIVLDKTGKIVFLTRLFDEKEYKAMIEKINNLIAEDQQP